jgi:hypothetical protein
MRTTNAGDEFVPGSLIEVVAKAPIQFRVNYCTDTPTADRPFARRAEPVRPRFQGCPFLSGAAEWYMCLGSGRLTGLFARCRR